MPDSEWPYDADQNDPLAAMRIPVTSAYPGWKYEVALCLGELWHDPPLRPTDAEAALIAAFIDYRREWYNPGWRAKLLARPLDTDSGTNTVVLLKRGEDDWCYRRDSWQHGPLFVPPAGGAGAEVLSLAALLDKINDYHDGSPNPRWSEYKARHPEVFND